MNMQNSTLDWAQVQIFLAVAENGSLSAAARAMGVSQPTIGRQIHAMEVSAGADLFRRQPQGMELTTAGQALIEPARAMRDAARQLELRAAGTEGKEALSGTVRITASEFGSHHTLPPIIAKIRQAEPDIDIELVATDTSENLLFREADIAVRMFQPTQLDIVARPIGGIRLGLFGSKSYLDRRGRPSTIDEVMTHDFVGYDRNEDIINGFREQGIEVTRDFFATRCDHHTVNWELVRAGCGLGFAMCSVGKSDPSVEQILIDLPIPPLPVWLAAHERLRRTARISRVWDMLAEGLEQVCDALQTP